MKWSCFFVPLLIALLYLLKNAESNIEYKCLNANPLFMNHIQVSLVMGLGSKSRIRVGFGYCTLGSGFLPLRVLSGLGN